MKVTETQFTTDGGVAIDTATALFGLATALFVINVLPGLEVGFLQDDYKLMDNTQAWAWNFWAAIQQEGYTLGFRPLNTLQHSIFWNLLGEHLLFHRLVRISVHLAFGWLLVHTTLLLGASRLHAALVVVFYYASTVTNATIYYWVMFTPADILSLAALVLMLAGVTRGWSPRKLALSTVAAATAAVYTKESGIAAAGGVLLLTMIFWKRLTTHHKLWISTAHILLLILYLISYVKLSADKWMTLSEFSLSAAQTQVLEVGKGILISIGAPFSAIYLSMRNRTLSVLSACVVTALAVLSVAWLLWTAHGQSAARVAKALRSRLSTGIVILLLIVGFLVPYLPGRWFETRMLAGTFAMGTLFWGLVFGDALQACARESNWCSRGQYLSSLGVIVMLAALAAGNGFAHVVSVEEQTAQCLRAIVRRTQALGIRHICLVGFTIKGDFMRVRNARGVVGYESKRQVNVHTYASLTSVPEDLECVIVNYDERAINRVPLRVQWPKKWDYLSGLNP